MSDGSERLIRSPAGRQRRIQGFGFVREREVPAEPRLEIGSRRPRLGLAGASPSRFRPPQNRTARNPSDRLPGTPIAPGGIRTPNPRFRRPMLYPIELRVRDVATTDFRRRAVSRLRGRVASRLTALREEGMWFGEEATGGAVCAVGERPPESARANEAEPRGVVGVSVC